MIEVSILKSYSFTNLTYISFYYLIAVVLLFSGVSKIIDPMPMIETINQIPVLKRITEILPFGEVWWGFLPIIEIALGLMLVLKIQTKNTLSATTVLLFAFFVFSIYGTVIGLSTDCGCFGDAVKSEFGITMIIRNLVLVTITLWLAIVNKKFTPKGLQIN